MTASEGRAHPSPIIPILLVGVMSLLAIGAAILAIATGGSTSTGSSGAGAGSGSAHAGSLPKTGAGPGGIGTAPRSVRLTGAGGPVRVWYRVDPAGSGGSREPSRPAQVRPPVVLDAARSVAPRLSVSG